MKILNSIFSVRNDRRNHKIITIFGIKFKIKNKLKEKMLILDDRLKKTENNLSSALSLIEELKQQLNGVLRLKRHNGFTRNNLSLAEHQNNVDVLLRNLSEESKNNCLNILERHNKLYFNESVLITDIYDEEELKVIDAIRKFRKNTKKIGEHFENGKYKLPINYFEPSVLWHRNGCNAIKNKSSINGKTILDVGCYIADSALVFREEFPNSHIICFEPSPVNYKMALKTIELNNLTNVKIENIGLGNENKNFSMIGEGNCAARIVEDNDANNITIKTLDDYVRENDIQNIGLIKVDIEGFEQKFLAGAKNTICEQKPVLLLSIYHNYEDFFHIKPILESWNLGYKFDFFSGVLENTAEDEILLICELEGGLQ